MTGSHLWSRREALGLGLGGAAWATLGGIPAALVHAQAAADPDSAEKTLNLVLRYRTDAERIARVLPPGLEPDDEAEVTIDWWLHYPAVGEENLFFPGPYTESGIHVTARYQGHRGMFQVGMPLDQDWGRVRGRENVGLLKKDGILSLSREGSRVRADLRRRGKLLYRIETEILDRPAHPLFWHRETGYGAFLYRYRLNPDWRQGPLGDEPVELWLRVLGGKRGWYPEEMVAAGPRECDPARTRFEPVDPSPLDPFVEFPLREIVGISYRETGLAVAAEKSYTPPRTQTRIERLQEIDKARFAPWALYAYDRPITAGRVWTPEGWPEKRTALVLTAEEIERYRARPALELEARQILDVELEIPAALHAQTLPPPLDPGPAPVVRILAIDVGRSDWSTQPYRELWLASRCLEEGKEAWYALSHVVSQGGDVVYGRETFGYPSRMGDIGWNGGGGDRLEISGSRLGRDFARLGATPAATSGGAANETLTMVGLRIHPAYRVMTLDGFREPGAEMEIVAQPWMLELDALRPVPPEEVDLTFPDEPGPGVIGKPDPWYELAGGAVVKARAGRGVLRRAPARSLGKHPGLEPYFLERNDGATAGAEATSGRASHTFLVSAAQSGVPQTDDGA